MKILYLGDDNAATTSGHRAGALRRLGHEVIAFDPLDRVRPLLKGPILGRLHYYTGYRLLQPVILKWLKQILSPITGLDAIWVSSGEYLGAACLRLIKKQGCKVILYNNDDPTGERDGSRWASLLRAIPYYDLSVVVRDISVVEFKKLGAKNVLLVYRSYDEVAHLPFSDRELIPPVFRSEVAFIGTWMRYEKRDEFLLELINRGVPVSIWGERWTKSPIWNILKEAYRGPQLTGRDYVAAIQGSKICIGLLSKGNRDLHTQRSLEVPFAGGLLCAERTTEHMEMYKEGTEAVFWNDAAECATICLELLNDESRRAAIVVAGKHRVEQMAVGNEDMCRKVLKLAMGSLE